MDEIDSTPGHLRELRARWEADRSSRIFLQLAEEYRRVGRTEEAMTVLQEGLELHPNHLSAQVAMGRSLLDLERPREATESFEAILERDPTHLVANKLLVESRLRCGEAAGAAERLAHYRQLNAGDPEIPELESRIEAVRGEHLAPSAPPSKVVPQAAPAGDEPFPDLFSGRDRPLYDAALGRDGLFEVPAAPQNVQPEAESEVPAPSEAASEPDPDAPLEGGDTTATLGRLFLEQGHREEATTIFENVLERDPESQAARSGLVEAGGEPANDPAHEPASEAEAPPAANFLDSDATGSPGERRIELLKGYLQRIRRGEQRDVS